MPVRVDVPIRVRTDPLALMVGTDTLTDALGAACDRALGNSRAVVLEPRGGYPAVTLAAPEFVWYGEAAGEVGSDARDAVERLVRDALLAACERARVPASFRRSADTPAPLTGAPAEVLDPARYDPFLRRYAIPAYQGGGKPHAAPVRPAQDDAAAPEVDRLAWVRGGEFSDYADVQRLYAAAKEQFPDRPSGDHIGLIHKVTSGEIEVYFESLDNTHRNQFVFSPMQRRTLADDGTFRPAPGREAQPGITLLRRILTVGSSREDRIAVLTALFAGGIRSELEERATKLGTVSTTEFRDALDARVAAEIALRETTFPRHAVAIAQLDVLDGGTQYLALPAGANFEWTGTAVLLPVAAVIHRRDVRRPDGADGDGGDEGDGAGTGSGTGRGRGGTGAGTGRGAGQGAGGRGLVDIGGEPSADEGGGLFPSVPWAERDELTCEPYIGEPALDTLGPDAQHLLATMREIASTLDIPECAYGGNFALTAAATLEARAGAIGEYAAWLGDRGFLENVASNAEANLNLLAFRPTASPAVQFMRQLAAVVPKLSSFATDLFHLYDRFPNALSGAYHGNAPGWAVHFFYEFNTTMIRSCAIVYGETCRVLFLQLLQTSRDTIYEHQLPENRTRYITAFREVVLPQLQRVDALMALRARLDNQIYDETHVGDDPEFSTIPADPTPDMVTNDLGYTTAIRDEHGKVWTSDDLTRAIDLRRGVVEEIDPIVKQFTDLPDVMRRIGADGANVGTVIDETFRDMLDNNLEQLQEARDSWMYAFRCGKIHESLPGQSVGGIMYQLQGIHLMAHQQVAEFFAGDWFYAQGVNALFGGEEAWATFKGFIEFTGIVLLSVVCPPLGTAVGIAAAAYHLYEAHERESLYRALVNPDQLISWAEVETELFVARLGLALAFIPDAITIVRGGMAGLRVAAEEGLVAGARAARTFVAEEALQAMRAALRRGLVEAFVTECVKAEVLQALVERMLTPLVTEYEREIEATSPVGGVTGALALIARLNAGGGS